MSKRIPLFRMKPVKIGFAIVPDSEFERLSKFRWWGYRDGRNRYARRTQGKKIILLHREICPGIEVHHLDKDGWNNSSENLISVTRKQHGSFLRRKKRNAASRYIGVSWHRQRQKWTAAIREFGVRRYLGIFKSQRAASRAYLTAKLGVAVC